jgi:hypothetical protein
LECASTALTGPLYNYIGGGAKGTGYGGGPDRKGTAVPSHGKLAPLLAPPRFFWGPYLYGARGALAQDYIGRPHGPLYYFGRGPQNNIGAREGGLR